MLSGNRAVVTFALGHEQLGATSRHLVGHANQSALLEGKRRVRVSATTIREAKIHTGERIAQSCLSEEGFTSKGNKSLQGKG